MRHGILVGLVSAVALVACRHAAVTRLASAPPKPSGCQLQLFASEAEVGRPFEALCLVDTELTTTLLRPVDPAAVAETARGQACQCGGDALIVTKPDAGTPEGIPMVVKVIRFTGP